MIFDYNQSYSKYFNTVFQTVLEGLEKSTTEADAKEWKIRLEELQYAKSFVLNKNIVSAIQNTKTLQQLSVPFNFNFLFPENFYVDGNKISVIYLKVSYFDKEHNLRHLPNPGIEEDVGKNNPEWIKGISGNYFIEDSKGGLHLRHFSIPLEFRELTTDNEIFKRTLVYHKEVENLLYGFLNFLNNPEVSYIVHKQKSNIEKRVQKGKSIPLINTSIKVSGKLKIYLDNYEKDLNNFSFSHRFWVRGHFRHLTSDQWKNKKGQTTWIVPYIKGKGILVNKTYEVVQ